ncbi:MAG TPA: hypothetical protein VHA09_01570 [Nitrososphaera sp.]|nr:hypothetical protein [Nitrososphaera sp.]
MVILGSRPKTKKKLGFPEPLVGYYFPAIENQISYLLGSRVEVKIRVLFFFISSDGNVAIIIAARIVSHSAQVSYQQLAL